MIDEKYIIESDAALAKCQSKEEEYAVLIDLLNKGNLSAAIDLSICYDDYNLSEEEFITVMTKVHELGIYEGSENLMYHYWHKHNYKMMTSVHLDVIKRKEIEPHKKPQLYEYVLNNYYLPL